ncbi:MAG: hypothetical protein KUG78_01300 [Kangiellaceae bacterium]|nr:hypothetical protein [Kangiellaceae bacterium]
MTQEIYTTPDSDVNEQIPANGPTKRTSTTAFGWVLLVMGGLGLILAIAGLLMILQMDFEMEGLSSLLLTSDAILSTLSKIGLIAVALGLIMRKPWIANAAKAGLVVSTIDTLFKAILIIPTQASGAVNEAATMGVYIGFYLVAGISLAIYIGLMFYIRSEPSRREFQLD